jgi:predicted RNA-binding Zn-ribbon protein involved in translation (DUF1610 family)
MTKSTLLECTDCGQFVSKNAKTCPNCGNTKIKKQNDAAKWAELDPTKKLIAIAFTTVIMSVYFYYVFRSGNKPSACGCKNLIQTGPDINAIYFKDETDEKMAAENLGWSLEKFKSWKTCREAYPGMASVTVDCNKEKYESSH